MKLMMLTILAVFLLAPAIQAEGCTRALVPDPMPCHTEEEDTDAEETCACGEMTSDECTDECDDAEEDCDGDCEDNPDCECDGTVDDCSGDCHDCDSIEDCDECEEDYDHCD